MPVIWPLEENVVVVKRAMPHSTIGLIKGSFYGKRAVWRGARGLVSDCRGGMFIETILLSGISGTRSSGARTERQGFAENIARNQIEYIFTLPYQEPPTLSWTGQDAMSHVANYRPSSDATLIRDVDGSKMTVARKVLSTQFSREGSVLKLTLEVQAAAGETELKSVDVYGRTLQ